MNIQLRFCIITCLFVSSACGTRSTTENVPAGAASEPATVNEAKPSAPRTSPSSTTQQNLQLDEPAQGATITTNPFTIKGLARTFENHVAIEIENSDGTIIKRTYATASGDLGHHNPFEKEIILTTMPGEFVTIHLVEHSAKDGSVRTRVSRRLTYEVEPYRMLLYFSAAERSVDCRRVSGIRRNVPKSAGVLRLAMSALLEGPTEHEAKGYAVSSPFPAGAELRGVDIRDGVAIVDFDERLQNVGGACKAEAIRSMVTSTVKANSLVKSVKIRAGGSEPLALQP